MDIRIIEVKNKKDFNNFINFPWKLYKNDPNWVPPLKMAVKEQFSPKHPFYETSKAKSWLAMIDNEIKGRIVAVINKTHNEFHEEECGFFGFFETTEDPRVAKALLDKAEDYLKGEGMKIIRGPINLSTNYECGLLIEGFNDPPQIMMTYNPPYYKNFIENLGYQKAMDLFAYRTATNVPFPEKMKAIAERAEQSQGITYRKVNKKNWWKEVDLMYEIYNDAWEKNWGFVPMSKNEFYNTAKELKNVVDQDLILFVEVKGQPAGFILSLPDYHQVFKKIPNGKLLPTGILKLLRAKKYINRIRVITMGVKAKYRKMGLASLMYKQMQLEVLNKEKLVEAEMSWILENNMEMNKPMHMIGADLYKKYRIFEKSL